MSDSTKRPPLDLIALYQGFAAAAPDCEKWMEIGSLSGRLAAVLVAVGEISGKEWRMRRMVDLGMLESHRINEEQLGRMHGEVVRKEYEAAKMRKD